MPRVRNEHVLKVAAEIVAERERQQSAEGWTTEHDDEHAAGELAEAATCYSASAIAWMANRIPSDPLWNWPWSRDAWKPKDARRDLIRSAALIVAEIERIDRAALRGEEASNHFPVATKMVRSVGDSGSRSLCRACRRLVPVTVCGVCAECDGGMEVL